MARWPHDDPASLAAFYGNPDQGEPGRQLVPVIPPFTMYYDGKVEPHIMFHKKAAGALLAALNMIWEHYGKDQATIDRLHISKYSGSYNPRKIRGSATRWSNHAYGAAIDLDADENGFNTGHGTMPQPVIDAFKAQGALWGGDYHGRTDPMHFEFCSRGNAPPPPRVTAPVYADNGQDAIDDEQQDQDEADDSEADSEATQTPSKPHREVVVVEPAPKSFWQKAQNWFLGGGGAIVATGSSWFSGIPPVTIAIILGFALIVFCIIWFTKKGNGW